MVNLSPSLLIIPAWIIPEGFLARPQTLPAQLQGADVLAQSGNASPDQGAQR